MAFRILATPRSFCATEGPHLELLAAAGCQVDLRPRDHYLSAPELAAVIGAYHGAILGLDTCDASVFARAGELRVVSRYGVGVDTVDLEAAAAHGVVVTNTPGANATAVAELALGMLFGLARALPQMTTRVKSGSWSLTTGWELSGKTLGIIGLGAIGRAVGERAHALGMTVLAYDPYAATIPPGIAMVPLQRLLGESDVVTLHAALTPETEGLLGAEQFDAMKPGAYLINTARGGLVDEEALYRALVGGRLAGAGLDAFGREPPRGSPLLELDSVIATPHMGSATHESIARMSMAAARNLLDVLEGRGSAHALT